jgi:hypothetical protein
MRYVRRVLQPGETIVYTTRLHWLIYSQTLVLMIISVILLGAGLSINDNQNITMVLGIGAVVFALIALFTGLRAFIRRAATELVESVDVDQSLFGRIFGYGTVVVRGTGGSLEPIRNIGEPLTFRSHITAGPSAQEARS